MSAAKHQKRFSGVDYSSRPLPEKEAPLHAKACGNWHIYIGTVQLFIFGDAPLAWLPCSEPEYRKGEPVGTPREHAIANRAIEILRTEQSQNPAAGPAEIRNALARATAAHAPLP